MAELRLGLLTSRLGLLYTEEPASQSPYGACLSATVVPHVCPGAEALCSSFLTVFLLLSCLWLIGGKETTGLMRDGLGQQQARRQMKKGLLGQRWSDESLELQGVKCELGADI